MVKKNRISIKTDLLENGQVRQLLLHHLREMRETTPEESVHALDIDELKAEDVTFWTLWIDGDLAGCGALKELDVNHGEIKSMRTHDAFLRRGVARKLLRHILDEAAERGYETVSLETSASDEFIPARTLYKEFGFTVCEPFGEYRPDTNSVFMTRKI